MLLNHEYYFCPPKITRYTRGKCTLELTYQYNNDVVHITYTYKNRHMQTITCLYNNNQHYNIIIII